MKLSEIPLTKANRLHSVALFRLTLRVMGEVHGIRVLEADIRHVERVLMERFITGGVRASGILVNRNGHWQLQALQRQWGRPKSSHRATHRLRGRG